jgi:RNA polymerase sigma-70 factor (ECF subfamily)
VDDATAATIEQAKRGDRAALARLLTSLQDSWFRFCLSLLRDADLARDATQETALRFLRQLNRFRGESSLKTWSLSVAVNVVREMKRDRRPSSGADPPELASDRCSEDFDALETAESKQLLFAQLDQLPDRQRQALVLRFFEELTIQQTASVMGCAIGTVKATVHQALRTLRTKMTQLK